MFLQRPATWSHAEDPLYTNRENALDLGRPLLFAAGSGVMRISYWLLALVHSMRRPVRRLNGRLG
jgi:hypothetical protein